MFPVLFEIFGYPFHTYSMMIAIGCIAGIWLAARHADRIGIDRNLVLDLCWWLVVGGLLGARIVFMIVNWEHHWYPCVDFAYYNATYHPDLPLTEATCLPLFNVLSGGLVFYGAFIGGIITLWVFTKKYGVKLLPMADLLIPSFAIGQFFGRLGCLGAGCCWGKHTDLPWGIRFPNGSMPFYQQWEQHLVTVTDLYAKPIHPTQIYDASYGLVLFFFLSWVRDRKKFDGQVLVTWLIAYPLLRSFVEIFRGDSERGFVFKYVSQPLNSFLGLPDQSITFLSTSQFISLMIVLGAIILMLYLSFKSPNSTQPAQSNLNQKTGIKEEEKSSSILNQLEQKETDIPAGATTMFYQGASAGLGLDKKSNDPKFAMTHATQVQASNKVKDSTEDVSARSDDHQTSAKISHEFNKTHRHATDDDPSDHQIQNSNQSSNQSSTIQNAGILGAIFSLFKDKDEDDSQTSDQENQDSEIDTHKSQLSSHGDDDHHDSHDANDSNRYGDHDAGMNDGDDSGAYDGGDSGGDSGGSDGGGSD
jgi:phosphatidylglycerol:prolipoprotein diacylglycerol transferase